MLSYVFENFSKFFFALPSAHCFAGYAFAGVFTLFLLWFRKYKNKKRNFPPGPHGLPLVGYLPFLGKESYKNLHKLSKKYGNVFSLKLGRTEVVILADFLAVKEALSKSETTDRPEEAFSYIPGGVGFSSVNGEEWIEQRRYCLKSMRDLGIGTSTWESLVQEEVEDVVKMVSKYDGRPFNITKILTASVSNNIATLVFGRRMPLDHQIIDFLNSTITGVGQFASQAGLRSAFPQLIDTLADWGLTDYAKNRKHAVNFAEFIKNQVRMHQNCSERNMGNFVDDYLLKIQENERDNLKNTFNDSNLYGNLNALFFASTETTRSSICWLLLIMATYRDIQNRVQAELDRVLGKEKRMIQWHERASVPYTYAVIMEGQRWKTLAPLNTPRIVTDDIKIGKYDIPKGTTIMANNWGLHNDTKYWKDPDEFKPERFLSDDEKTVNFRPESYVPFSYGKRNCPGDTVAMMEILFYFSALMLRFRVLPPKGKTVRLDGTLGLTFQPVPQELRFLIRE